jgi:hypothetical protein
MPSVVLRASVGAFRSVMAPKADFPGLQTTWIRPSTPLGGVRDAIFWKEENARRWVELGFRDGERVVSTFTPFTTETQRHGEEKKVKVREH